MPREGRWINAAIRYYDTKLEMGMDKQLSACRARDVTPGAELLVRAPIREGWTWASVVVEAVSTPMAPTDEETDEERDPRTLHDFREVRGGFLVCP